MPNRLMGLLVCVAWLLFAPLAAQEQAEEAQVSQPAPAAQADGAPLESTAPVLPPLPLQSEFFEYVVDSYDEQDEARRLGPNLLHDFLVALRACPQEYLQANARDDITYVDLMNRPENYRGQVVRLYGVLRQLQEKELPENRSGVTQVWMGQIANSKGHITSFISIEPLPPEMKLGRTIEICGIFMKRFAYLNNAPGEMLTWTPLVFVRHPVLPHQPGYSRTWLAFGLFGLLLIYLRVRKRLRRFDFFTAGKLNRAGETPRYFPRPGRKLGDR